MTHKIFTLSSATTVPDISFSHDSILNSNIHSISNISNKTNLYSNIAKKQDIYNKTFQSIDNISELSCKSKSSLHIAKAEKPLLSNKREMAQVNTLTTMNNNTPATMLTSNFNSATAGSMSSNLSSSTINNVNASVSSSASGASTQASPSGSYASASLYVGDLHPDVTEAMLYEIFNSVGPVASIRVCRDAVTRKSLGYAYVNYHAIYEAERALDTLNYTTIKGIAARIMWSHRDPSLRKSGAGNIFVKNLDKSIDNKALYDTFSLFGNILSCKVKTDDQGKSLGFGFVHYESDKSAKTAIEKVNGMSIGGKTVYVGIFLKRAERIPNTEQRYTNIYIKNIPHCWTEDKLKEIFGKFGEVTSMALRTDNKGRKFAFINYDNSEDARNAVNALNRKIVNDDGTIEDKEKDNEKVDDNAISTEESNGGEREKAEVNRLFVGPHQTKTQRVAMLKAKYENINNENKAKTQGVNLYIKNLDDSIDDNGLREMFEPYGHISSAKVMRDEKNLSRGFGFVCFTNPEDATKAVTEMHLKIHNRKPLYVGLAEKREQRLARMQHCYRFIAPNVRPNAGVNGALSGIPAGGISSQMHFGAPPQHMYYGGVGGAPGQMPSPPNRGGSVMPYQQNGVIPWRSQASNSYGGGGGGGIPQQNSGMRQMNFMGMYSQPNAMHLQMAGGGGSHINAQMGSMMGGRGGASRDGNMGHKQLGLGVSNMNKNMHMNSGGDGGAVGSYKFTAQARNKSEFPVHSQGLQQGINSMHQQHVHQQACDLPLNAGINADAPLTAATLATVGAAQQKQYIGEKLFPLIARFEPQLAGKITGMMLEMDNTELIGLIDSPIQLRGKVDEALRVLQQANEH